MRLLQEIAFMFWRSVLEKVRNSVFIFIGIFSPIIYLAFFAPLMKSFMNDILDVFVPGMLVMICFFNGINVGWGIIDELRDGVIERFKSTAASRFALLTGPVLCDVLSALIQSLIFIFVSLPFGFHINFGGALVLLLLLSILVASLAYFTYAVALIVKNEEKLGPIVQGVGLPVMLLSGMLLPMSLAPRWLQILAHFNPVYYVVEASRLLSRGQIFNQEVALALGIVILFAIGMMSWSIKIYRKAVY